MKKILFILFIVFFGNGLKGQNVNFDWVAHFGEMFWEKGKSVTVDVSGNVYSTGYFHDYVDFDPGPGVFTLSAVNDTYGFISKLDQNRNFIWAKKIEGSNVHGLSIKTDVGGNVFIFGSYGSRIDLDPGPAVLDGNTTHNIFLIKLNSAGDFIWGKTLGPCNVFNVPFNIALDASGNVYISGNYGPQMDFDPGPGVYTLTTVDGSIDIFVLKLDTNGAFVWAKSFGSKSPFDEGNAIAVDGVGNVYLTGVFTDVVDFDPGPGVNNITVDNWTAFILKLNTQGEFEWVKHMAAISRVTAGHSIAADQLGNVFFGGVFTGGGPTDFFICKLDVAGNFIWTKMLGGAAPEEIKGIALDASGNVYATGSFYITADFDPGPSIYNLTAAGEKDVFIVKLDTQGNFVWAKSAGGSLNDYGTAIVIDGAGSVYTIGAFEAVADFDPGPGIANLSSLGFDDIFILKLSRCASNSFSSISVSVCSNYVLNNQTYNSTGTYTQTLTNAAGCDSIITLNLTINRKFTTVNASICQGQSYFAGGTNQTTAGIYKDTLLTSLGCDSIITTTLTVLPKPTPNLGPDRNLCSNGSTSITPGIFNSYLWQDNSTQPSLIVSNSGKYWVTVTDANNCSATDTLTVLAIDTVPKNFLPADQLICYGIGFNITVPGYKNYLWSTGDISNTVAISNPGTYYLSVTDSNNCTGKDTVVLQRNYNCIPVNIPNAFTPNKDGTNDIFKPIITQEVSDYSFTIFNRYGQKIFASNKYGTGWDGTFKGVAQPRNAYIYLLNFKNNNGELMEYKGTVTLIR
jgi:gliding motility-associated-like protein